VKRSALLGAVAAPVVATAVHDLLQKRHTVTRNFPVVGHARFWLERIGPELRQYIVAANDEERPFSRDQRRWVYASAKGENNYFSFGTDNDLDGTPGYLLVRQKTLAPVAPEPDPRIGTEAWLPCAKVLGEARGRRHAFRPDSLVNISAMSFGSLSGSAVTALNRGAALAGCLHNSGEGGISRHHLQGGDLVFQIGTAYFGCRDERGRFDLQRLKDRVAAAPVRAIEVKLSQGAKPGLGGHLPGEKVSAEIAEARGVPEGVDCISPPRHAEFSDVDGLLDFLELLAAETGLPVGIKSAVGDMRFWEQLCTAMRATGRGPDFVSVDGGEGGTGAAPMAFSDHVSLPFRLGFSRVYGTFARHGLHEQTVFVGAGKLGLPDNGLVAMALGCDLLNVGREAMLAIGCIQAQKCHTDHCPTGVATQNAWLARGLDPAHKSVRAANYVKTLRRDLLKLAESVGVQHPGLVCPDDLELLDGLDSAALSRVYGYEPGWGLPSERDREAISALMTATAPEGGSAPASATAQS